MDYGYMSEKLSYARSCLMLPHPRGEAESVTSAMNECMHALSTVGDKRPDDLEPYLSRLVGLIDTTGLDDPRSIGLHAVSQVVHQGRTASVLQYGRRTGQLVLDA